MLEIREKSNQTQAPVCHFYNLLITESDQIYTTYERLYPHVTLKQKMNAFGFRLYCGNLFF